MDRPKCVRCGEPLNLWHDEDGWRFTCQRGSAVDDRSFWAAWEQLPGDDVVRLLKRIEDTGQGK